MDTYEYTCEYCGNDFLPKRRYVQRFCSTSCRVGSHNRKKKSVTSLTNQNLPVEKQKEQKGITFTGIAEAGIGTLAADSLKTLLTRPEDRPVTKAELDAAVEKIERMIRPQKTFPPLLPLKNLSPINNKEEDNFKSGHPW